MTPKHAIFWVWIRHTPCVLICVRSVLSTLCAFPITAAVYQVTPKLRCLNWPFYDAHRFCGSGIWTRYRGDILSSRASVGVGPTAQGWNYPRHLHSQGWCLMWLLDGTSAGWASSRWWPQPRGTLWVAIQGSKSDCPSSQGRSFIVFMV